MEKNKKENYRKFQKYSTLCWECEKACGGCSWSKDFVPVEGWEAIPTKLLIGSIRCRNGLKKLYTDSFDVYYCPEFELLEMLKSDLLKL